MSQERSLIQLIVEAQDNNEILNHEGVGSIGINYAGRITSYKDSKLGYERVLNLPVSPDELKLLLKVESELDFLNNQAGRGSGIERELSFLARRHLPDLESELNSDRTFLLETVMTGRNFLRNVIACNDAEQLLGIEIYESMKEALNGLNKFFGEQS